MNKLVLDMIIIFQLLLLVSCSGTKRNKATTVGDALVFGTKDYAEAFVSQIRPRWFKTAERFKLLDSKNQIMPHRFFDVAPGIDLKKKTANIIITTPQESLYGHELDIASGQLYVDRKFCDQEDKQQKYEGSITTPPFSIGILPRVLDQLNLPQKVIVFGGKDYFKKYYMTHFFDVRIVGAYIEQTCPYGACLRKKEWNSKLVLVAVQNGHKKYKNVKDLNDLKEIENWPYVKAFIENGYGANKVADKYYSSFKMGAEVTSGQALNYMKDNSTIFTIKRLGQMRLSCYKLYDYLWEDMSYISTDEIVAKSKKEIREKALQLSSSFKGKTKRVKPFYRRLIKNFKKYHTQYMTCSKYIYPTNINDSPQRNWFFAFYTAFHDLHDLGYIYECKGKKWEVNPYIAKNTRAVSMKDQLQNCSARDIDLSMETAVTTLETIRKRERKSYRYIDYDRGIIGTHFKLYSWVPVAGKSYSCSSKEDREFIVNRASFPQDIHWTKRGKQGKTKSALGDIIY